MHNKETQRKIEREIEICTVKRHKGRQKERLRYEIAMHSMQEQVKERLMFPVLRNNETRDRNKD